jgi:mRNA-degrading endonuclease toxin of MazEF toxin-antitoxin module
MHRRYTCGCIGGLFWRKQQHLGFSGGATVWQCGFRRLLPDLPDSKWASLLKSRPNTRRCEWRRQGSPADTKAEARPFRSGAARRRGHGYSSRRERSALMAARKLWAPDRRDMIWINCNPQAGREMKDIHPLRVLSPKAFNVRTGIVIGLPMTTAAFNETNPFAVEIRGRRREGELHSRSPAEVVRLAVPASQAPPLEANSGRRVHSRMRDSVARSRRIITECRAARCK